MVLMLSRADPKVHPQPKLDMEGDLFYRSVEEADERTSVIKEAESWLGTPYVSGGAVKGAGVDCGMLPIMTYSAVGVIPFKDPRPYSEQWHIHQDEEWYKNYVSTYGQEIEGPPLPGDLVLFKFGRVFSHSGIVYRWPFIVHVMRGTTVMKENVERCKLGPKSLGHLERKYFSPWT
jgi:cell wall-associated NlpC family hydrolase